MNDSIPEKILAAVTQKPGLTSREIASQLTLDKKEVNSILYGPLKGKCRQDDKYRWFPVFGTSQVKTSATDEPSLPDTPFARLCRYYLACLSQDEDVGISVFAANRYDDLDYHELDELPLSTGSSLFQSDGARRLLGRIRSDRGRLAMYLGYPCALKHQRSRKSNWEGFFIEPLLLFPVEMGESRGDSPSLETGFPIFNHAALRRLSNAERDGFLEELVQLEKELPLNTEQRQAIEKAMVAPLTIITGPPGTGKSQVVYAHDWAGAMESAVLDYD